MFRNYLTTAIRSLFRSKTHSLVNIFGLALGIACVFFIGLYLQHELSYDRFHDKAENLYRVVWGGNDPQTRTPHPMAQALKSDFPEVENAVSLTPLYTAGLTRETHSFRIPGTDKRFDEKNALAVDTTFFDVFSFRLVKGDPSHALKHVNGILLSESLARKYFGDEDPIGKQLSVDGDGYLLEVVGVFEDVPENSHFDFDILVSYVREKSFDLDNPFFSWNDFGHYNYIRLRDGADAKALEKKILPWLRKYLEVSDEQYAAIVNQGYGFKLQPVTDIHLHSRLRWELSANGNIEYVYLLAIAGLLTLIIAGVNFMNLTTAKWPERAKEIGVRKTLGAGLSQLRWQFLGESVVTALIAVVVSIFLVEMALPMFNSITGFSFTFVYQKHGPILLAFGTIVGLLAGLYPSLYLAELRPHLILKGRMIRTPGGVRMRKGLIVFQFFMSMVLVSSTIVIYRQLEFLGKKDLGFRKEAVIVIPVKDETGMRRFEAFQQEVKKVAGVVEVSASSNIPGGDFNAHHIASLGFPEDELAASEVLVDCDFFNVLGIDVSDGRTFSKGIPADSNAFVVNETAARQLRVEGSLVGQEIWWVRRELNEKVRGRVIGVVKDFHFQSLHEPIRPLIFMPTDQQFNHILVRVDTEDFDRVIADIEKVYKRFDSVFGFEFSFLEHDLNALYASEKRTVSILTIFAIVATSVACIGLFGMSVLTFQQRIKELSVRKVLGATLMNILVLQLGDLTRLILIAVVLATPVSWWAMNDWLKNFSYQINIHPLTFAASGLMLIVVAWLTLGYFSVKAARLNPAETLKSE